VERVTVECVASRAPEIVLDLSDLEVVTVAIGDCVAEKLSEGVRDHRDLENVAVISSVADAEREMDLVPGDAVSTTDSERSLENVAKDAETVLVRQSGEKVTFRDFVGDSVLRVAERLLDNDHVVSLVQLLDFVTDHLDFVAVTEKALVSDTESVDDKVDAD
jgi:hypothetical protein